MLIFEKFKGNALNYKQTCASTIQCASSLICLNGVCNCTSATLFWNGTYCGNYYIIFYNYQK